ncbi:metallophosphoesterase family protein [Lamprocystis purpurea]|jgi:3',5'-cyclic AMP phosphodiesterase CpdA|uniref:metallophosphoesterase family protein n=1 Tax=Lamprocystis purpurea TaxID=61598 RepID=UPI0003A338C1|nr:metallophosphoesterase [Lamprocystis purpurea]MBV5346799.1 metallophosphoesterase [bacterium]
MKFKVLVIDDRLGVESRRNGYVRLAQEIEARVPGFSIELDWAERPSDITIKLRQNRYSAALVDAVLTELWPSECDLDFAMSKLDDSIPIALLSSHWDDTNAAQLNRALLRPNCNTILHWRDIAGEGGGCIEYAVAQFSGMIANRQHLRLSLDGETSDSIRILHISDLQFGGIDASKVELEAMRSADRVLAAWSNQPPTFIAFSGDIAEHALPSEYKSALRWLEFFFGRLGISWPPNGELLVVPGNHDVSIAIAAASRIELERDEGSDSLAPRLASTVKNADLITEAYAPFRQFMKTAAHAPLLSEEVDETSFAWVEARYRHLGVVFYGINTACPASPHGVPKRQVDANALAQIGVEIGRSVSSGEKDGPLIIGISHHSPISASGDKSVTNPEDFATFFKGRLKTALFLHGHIHEQAVQYLSEDGFRMVRSCASTLAKEGSARPRDSLRGFNLLELSSVDGRRNARLCASSFGWIGGTIKEISSGEWERDYDGMFREARVRP